ncbi:MAG TPA: phosphoglucomutase/phosphomannomutase family protein [Balneolales bacterium]|nr:phosphoglucomutase/phosphomannomutase family protein [Balneolales bacterium]
MADIKFGTDGWRAVIAKDYTYDNLSIVTQATARWIRKDSVTNNGVIIGYDGRFGGRDFARHVASVFAAMDISVRMADRITPTPAISWAALEYDAVGIVITASHNPPNYNGFKIKAPFGGPATPAQIDSMEKEYGNFDNTLKVESYDTYLKHGMIREIPLRSQYMDVIRERIDLDAIKSKGVKIAHDAMFGAGQHVIKELLGDQVHELRSDFNPGFHGQAPEPIEKNLQNLSKYIKDNRMAIGIANDGDADRVGLYDETGAFVNSHLVLALLTKYMSQDKKEKGSIIKTFSTTDLLDKQGDKYGLDLQITPIGFKYIAEKIVNGDVLVGGEESGGLAVKGHIPERDGIFIGLLITEMMVKKGKSLSELVQELFDEFGTHYQYRDDLHTSDEKKNAMMKWCENEKVDEIAGKKVTKRGFTDGVKHWLEDGSWLLVRPSGTEPVLRIYSESDNEKEAEKLVNATADLVNDPKILKG